MLMHMKRAIGFVLLLAFAATIGIGTAAGADDVPPSAEAIFASARTAWPTNYPRYATYTVALRYRKGERVVQRHYLSADDLRRNIILAHTFSNEEVADPGDPSYALVFKVFGFEPNKKEKLDPVGPLALAINYDFGIAANPQHATVVTKGVDIDRPSNLPEIGRTGFLAREYAVTLLDTSPSAYHIGLEPLRDPGRLRLRELFIDRMTHRTTRAIIAGNFNRKPLNTVRWAIDFSTIEGAQYITRETALEPIDYGKAGNLEDMTVTFNDFKRVALIPSYLRYYVGDADRVVEP